MIFKELKVTDFRAFSGEHVFDLEPRKRLGESRPIVLFGGLNGSGKTTTLLAIRVAIHGRQSLGQGTSTAQYHAFLTSCVHKNPQAVIEGRSSSISLSLKHAHRGVVTEYKIDRAWSVASSGQLSESLSLTKAGEPLDELNYDQCQSFLNELIPPGVADLFLFDGEKIADLAEDTNGATLSGALKKLVGIDLLETLQTDLKATQRRGLKRNASKVSLDQINSLEEELVTTEEKMQTARTKIAEWNSNLSHVASLKDRKNNEILSRGGAWAEARNIELKKEVELHANLDVQKNIIRELLGSNLPFAHAPNYCARVLNSLEEEIETQQRMQFDETFNSKVDGFKKAMSNELGNDECNKVERILLDAFLDKDVVNASLLHDMSPLYMGQFASVLENSKNIKEKADKLAEDVRQLSSQLEMTERNIARAPDEEILATLKTEFDDLVDQEIALRTNLVLEKKSLKETIQQAIGTTISIKKLTSELNTHNADARLLQLCEQSIGVVSEFTEIVTKRKLKQLEDEFYESYKRLARKKGAIPRAVINPNTFHVALLNTASDEIDKNDMSAGEKQIYAIAMLNALGNIASKSLPVIIDTPLGRLDSKHRDNIVENYFPYASHQVIILSTDTEIHEAYQEKLSDFISHTIKLEYSEVTNSTKASNGYFWNTGEVIAV